MEDEGVQAVHRIGGGVIVAVRPLAQHGGGDPDGGVGQDLVVAPSREVAQEEIEHGDLTGRIEIGDRTFDLIVTKGRHIGDKGGCGIRLGPQGQGTVAGGLAAAHHVQVEAGQDPVRPVIFVGQPGIGAGELRHEDDPDTPLERWEFTGVQEPLEHPEHLHGATNPTGIVIGAGLGVAKMGHQQDLLLGLPLQEGFHQLNGSGVEAGIHPAAGRRVGGLGAVLFVLLPELEAEGRQLIPLSGAKHVTEGIGFKVRILPPEGAVVPGIVEVGPGADAGDFTEVVGDKAQAAPVLDGPAHIGLEVLPDEEELALQVQPLVGGLVGAPVKENNLDRFPGKVAGKTLLDDGKVVGLIVGQPPPFRSLQIQPGPLAVPLQEGLV